MDPEVLVGDCIVAMSAIARLHGESYDLVVADPPYNIGIDYGQGAKRDRLDAVRYAGWTMAWVAAAADLLKPNGSMWVIAGQEHAADVDKAMQAAGLTIRNRITWYESFGVACRKKFARTSRPIYYGVKNPKAFTFNALAVVVPSARQTKYGDRRAVPGGKIMDDVWPINRVCGTFVERVKGVPTQLPESLVRRIIGVSSNPGDQVFDPFVGSGTVLAVARSMGRSGAGTELNPEYAEIARKRILAVESPEGATK